MAFSDSTLSGRGAVQREHPGDHRPGSNHFFFDMGNDNLLAFFDFPFLDVDACAEVLGEAAPRGHLCRAGGVWTRLKANLEEAGHRALT